MAKKGKKKSDDQDRSQILRNKRAFHNYEILEKLECGMVLQGTEVKSLRDRNVSFADSYVRIEEGELYLIGLNIAEYRMGNIHNHEPTRRRKLLAHTRQIRKLRLSVEAKGMTLVPLRLYWKEGKAKIEIGLARGKATHDKRESIRDRDLKRQKQRIMRTKLK